MGADICQNHQPPFVLMNILIWNTNETTSQGFRRTLKEFIRIHKPEIVGLLGTKVSGYKADNFCNKLGFDYWVRV